MGQATPLFRHPVLIIEDEPIMRLDAIDMVEEAGFEAVEAVSIAQALDLLASRPDIRIVYMDLDLPRSIQGIEIAIAIRDRWPPIEIILTAAYFTRDELALPARAEFYSKPISRDEVQAAMRRLTAQVHRDDDARG